MVSLKDIPHASTLRCTQQTNAYAHNKEVAERNEQFIKSFTIACDKYFDNIITEVKRIIETSKKTTKTYAILNDTNITQPIDGFFLLQTALWFLGSPYRKVLNLSSP